MEKKVFTSVDVRKAELARILERRKKAKYKNPGHPEKDAVGLALSGGGIRSATFNLGILQALERCGLLRCIDYISTVSGGGYIGSSLTWFMSRLQSDRFPFDTMNPQTDKFAGRLLARLRERGNYLIPGDGLTWWALIATLLTGIIVNLIVVVPVFLCILGIMGIKLSTFPFFTSDCLSQLTFYKYVKPTLFTAGLFAGLFSITGIMAVGVVFSLLTRFSAVRKIAVQRRINKLTGKILMYGTLLAVVGTIPIVTGFIEDNLSGWIKTAISSISLAGIISICGGLAGRKGGNEAKGFRSFLLSFGLALLMYGVFLWLYHISKDFSPPVYIAAFVCSLIIAFFADVNHVSMHRFYRNRLMEAYMPVTLRDDRGREDKTSVSDYSVNPPVPAKEEDADLCLLHTIGQTKAPYHIVNTTIQTVGSRLPKLNERGGDNFIFSPLFCGSDSTSYVESKNYIGGKVNLATAMAISGAAVDPNTYATRSRPLTFLMTMLNVRLGYWIRNPRYIPFGGRKWRNPSWYRVFSEMLGRGLSEKSSGIHLSDGGGFENLALYELIRRECRIIIVCDAGKDNDYVFDDLAKAIERVRVDFEAEITLDTRPMRPPDMTTRISKEACVCGTITYRSGLKGVIVYINTTLIGGLSEDIYSYQRRNPAFPDQGTGDQFFDEQQFEAYRELGLQLGVKYFEQLSKTGEPLDILNL